MVEKQNLISQLFPKKKSCLYTGIFRTQQKNPIISGKKINIKFE